MILSYNFRVNIMKLVNLTGGHSINFFTEEQCSLDEMTKKLILKEGESPYQSYPA